MKLLINTESLAPPMTGIGIYTLNLLKQFIASGEFEAIKCFSGHYFSEAKTSLEKAETDVPPDMVSGSKNGPVMAALRNSILAYRAREAMRNTLLQMRSRQFSDFVYHEPNFILKRHKGPAISTIHDLSFISYPQHHPSKRVAWLNAKMPDTLARADMIITDSEQVRRELIERYQLQEQKVRAIHLGAADHYAPQTAAQTHEVLSRYSLVHGQYLLFVGTLEPRKGVDVLMKGWANLPSHLKKAFPLVLAGAPGWGNKSLQAQIDALRNEGLRHLSFVPASDLPSLYAGAGTFVYPSYYEGFGLPVLEAMKSGVPVICTGDTSMSEITGEHALHIRAGDVDQLIDHMQSLLEDDILRASMSVAGITRAQTFSWEKCARQTMGVYRLFGV
ncbi:glycosyltransferase family 1 protein [Pseudomonas sp. RC10]|uniref:glycosyltransferase family 4 protein n=1 Tax=Pseudomonas bambusae TaxID=3139142 RepID=UPI003139612F